MRTWRGIMPGRSGNLQIISRFPDYIGAGLTHSSPYDYTQEVPFFLYGPGYVEPGDIRRAGDAGRPRADRGRAASTSRFDAPDGTAQTEALEPDRPLPRLVVTLVWDSGGMDVLDTWPKDWPYLKSIMDDGAWFTHASVGASPSNTPTGHATIGTGAFPDDNGFVDEYMKVNNRIEKPNENGPGVHDRADVRRPLRRVDGQRAARRRARDAVRAHHDDGPRLACGAAATGTSRSRARRRTRRPAATTPRCRGTSPPTWRRSTSSPPT